MALLAGLHESVQHIIRNAVLTSFPLVTIENDAAHLNWCDVWQNANTTDVWAMANTLMVLLELKWIKRVVLVEWLDVAAVPSLEAVWAAYPHKCTTDYSIFMEIPRLISDDEDPNPGHMP